MSISKGVNNINSIRLGTNEIGKAYLGNNLVYNHDAPVWMLRNANGVYYSLDGINYIELSSGASSNASPNEIGCYCNGKFIFSRQSTNKLYSYDLGQLRKGNLQETELASDKGFSIASDGNDCIVCSNSTGNLLNYSLDGGETWATRTVTRRNVKINYIGSGEFWLSCYDSSYPEAYFFWSRNNPTNWYRRAYYLPNSETPTTNGWCINIENCNGRYYVTSKENNECKLYYGTKTNANGLVNCNDIKNVSGFYRTLVNITYVYNKYYAILGSGYDSYNYWGSYIMTKDLYVSDDGITFTKRTNFFPNEVYQISKNNGKLCVYGKGFIGIVNSNENLSYTTIPKSNDDAFGSFVSNKFHKM